MLKKFSKILLLVLLIGVVSSSSLMCFADEEHNHTDTVTTTQTNEETNSTNEDTPEIHNGDLYLFGNDVVMDKYVDGNVFIFGNNVKVTGQVNGNLYVLGNQVDFNDCLIRYSIFTCANSVYYNNCGTYEGDVYIAAKTLETTFSSYVARDIKAIASNITFKSAVGRDVDFISNTLDLGEGEDVPLIYGNIRYTADREISIPESSLEGTATYTKQNNIVDTLLSFGTSVVTVLALFIILNKLTPSFLQTVSNDNFSVLKLLKAFGIGLATIATVLIFVFLLVGTRVGILLAVILALLFSILYIVSMPVLSIIITNKLKPALKIEKTSMFYLIITLVSIILHGITLIPYVGVVLGFIINTTAIGLIVNVFLPHKELTEEEQISLKEAKKLAKEIKEKRKQEKLEAKNVKKQDRLKLKEAKKQENAKLKNDKKVEKSKSKEPKQKKSKEK